MMSGEIQVWYENTDMFAVEKTSPICTVATL